MNEYAQECAARDTHTRAHPHTRAPHTRGAHTLGTHALKQVILYTNIIGTSALAHTCLEYKQAQKSIRYLVFIFFK